MLYYNDATNPAIVEDFDDALFKATAYYCDDYTDYEYFNLLEYEDMRDWCNYQASRVGCCLVEVSVFSYLAGDKGYKTIYSVEV